MQYQLTIGSVHIHTPSWYDRKTVESDEQPNKHSSHLWEVPVGPKTSAVEGRPYIKMIEYAIPGDRQANKRKNTKQKCDYSIG